MWMSTLARFARPIFQRSPSPVLCKAMKACRRMELLAPSFCMTPVHIRRHQTLGSAPMPVAAHSMRHVRALHEERLMAVEWEDGGQSLYPFTWLRDNCQCSRCTLQSAEARLLLMADLDIHIGMDSVEVTKDGKVSIAWPDQHTSVFDAEWLKKRCFSDAARQAMQEELFLNERYYWDATLRIPQADFQEVLHDDGAALAWLMALRQVGIVHLKGAPAEQGQVARLAERIGYLRLTFYGHTWQVQDKSMANNVAYTSGKLSLHTDYPALHFAPGVQFLHCIKQAKEGGESEVVDGFHMAKQLQREDPEAFRTLTSLRVDFTDTGTDYCDFMLQSKNRIIEALKAYVDIMNRPENVVTYTMKPGDIVTFDNWRLLHGRKSYISRPDRLRHLEGAYLDWDEVMSRLRIVRRNVHGDTRASDKRSHLH
ncbi:gamma-butyrobetaine dioxygenase isoform X2 [Poeciliopsis prolifica]|uniref:gamma-butyrobetaine dioxygenase isoform X2 n=1 Tax=Poeciliopsis prolifica TaxID=188132 RepID=UPI0024133651|nr:gamma-butyrobetaine dioxygenase isoform X2 [Poeciliopsis prolifica]